MKESQYRLGKNSYADVARWEGYVQLSIDDNSIAHDRPQLACVHMTPSEARQFAAELLRMADEVASRTPT